MLVPKAASPGALVTSGWAGAGPDPSHNPPVDGLVVTILLVSYPFPRSPPFTAGTMALRRRRCPKCSMVMIGISFMTNGDFAIGTVEGHVLPNESLVTELVPRAQLAMGFCHVQFFAFESLAEARSYVCELLGRRRGNIPVDVFLATDSMSDMIVSNPRWFTRDPEKIRCPNFHGKPEIGSRTVAASLQRD
jgi:hypothetical protein